MDMSNTPIIVSEVPPRRRLSTRSFATTARIGDRTSSGVSTSSANVPAQCSMDFSSTSQSSTSHNRSFHQTFIENWILKTSNQHSFDDCISEEGGTDNSINDLPPWASPRNTEASWHKPSKSFVAIEENGEEEEETNNEYSFSSLPNILDENEETEQNDNLYLFSTNEYSVMAATTNYVPLSDDEEETTAEYKTASTTLRSPDIIHREINQELEDEIRELCKPHAAPNFNEILDTDSQDTIPYTEEDNDTQSYNPNDEEAQLTQLYSQEPVLESIAEMSNEKDDFIPMPDLPDSIDDGDYVSPLTSEHGEENNELGNSPPIFQFFEDDKDVQEEDFMDELTEKEILQLEQAAALTIKTTRKGKRKISDSPTPVAEGSQIVKLDKKQIRTSIVKKPPTIHDYFLHPTTINDETEQDIGKESSTPSFTVSSSGSESIDKKTDSQTVDARRRPRFGLSRKSYH